MKFISAFFLQVVYQYKLRVAILAIYALICGYLIPYWPMLLEGAVKHNLRAQIFLIGIACLKLSFTYIKELFMFPIYNYATYKLRSNFIEAAHKTPLEQVQSGTVISSLTRSSAAKYIIKNTTSLLEYCITIPTSLYLIYKLNPHLGIASTMFCFVYATVLYAVQNFYKILRNNAWEKSARAGNISKKMIDQTKAIRQNLFKSTSDMAFRTELRSWGNYYFKTNFYSTLLALFSISLFVFTLFFVKSDVKLLLLVWNLIASLRIFSNSIKIFYMSMVDLQIFHERSKETSIAYEILDHLVLKNVHIKIHDKFEGPINFETKSKLLGITGNNGVGKTRLALAISALTPYHGVIAHPCSVYVGLENKFDFDPDVAMLSDGENAMKILEEACKCEAKMIIIDELLDILSQENLIAVWSQLTNSGKMLIIISHKQNILEKTDEIIEIKPHLKIQQFTKLVTKN